MNVYFQARWLSDYYIVRVTAFHNALGHIADTIPALGGVLGTTLDKLLDITGVPESISFYAASYCSQSSSTGNTVTRECSLHVSPNFDIAAGVRVILAVAYALGIASSIASLYFCLYWMLYDCDKSRHWAKACTWLACGAVCFASITTTILACVVYTVFTKNIPHAILSVSIGGSFLAFTWSACFCLALALVIIDHERLSIAQRLQNLEP
ncbi:hypothetical protein GQ44DRAFT_731145 [Phaeosphaeriaceae sp. PMI808]|nr:hypothetical protein GQ44DRAFT_731145 [Phaeosphaeriaceae sp. PMI808]